MHFDADGGVIQTNGDAGDRPARTGLYHLLIWWRRNILQIQDVPPNNIWPFANRDDFVMFLFMSKDNEGNYFRGGQWLDPRDMSRDQFWGILAACTVYRLKVEISSIADKFCRNFCRAPNGDPIGPSMWAMIFRGMGWWWLYPITVLFDLEHLINTLVLCFIKGREPGKIQKWLGSHVHWIFVAGEPTRADGSLNDPYGPGNVGGDINHIKPWLIGRLFQRSPVLWLSWAIYNKFRPGGVQAAWDIYFNPKTGANPFNEIVRPILAH